jgi:hypothetical protein
MTHTDTDTHTDTPAVGDWCPITRGFWTGGRYVRASELTQGDVIRVGTYTGYRVTGVSTHTHLNEPCVHVRTAGNTLPLVFTPGTILESIRTPRFNR